MDPTDRIALHELAARYGDTIDARDWAGLDRVFTADVVWENPALPGRDLVGVDQVRRFMARAGHPLAHHITNVRVEVTDDGPVLHSRVILVQDDGSTRSGSYRDEVVRTEDGWRVHRRAFTARVRPDDARPAEGS